MFWKANLAGLLLVAAATTGARAGPGENPLWEPQEVFPLAMKVHFAQPFLPTGEGDATRLFQTAGYSLAEQHMEFPARQAEMFQVCEAPEPQAEVEPELGEAWFDPKKFGWHIVHLLVEGALAVGRFIGRREGIPV